MVWDTHRSGLRGAGRQGKNAVNSVLHTEGRQTLGAEHQV